MYRIICRQVQVVIVRQRKSVPRHGEDLEPPGEDQKRRGDGRCSYCRLASSGKFGSTHLPGSKLTLLPKQIEDAQANKQRPNWVNFKQVIWHKSFYKLLKSIEAYAVTGCWVKCGDEVERNIYPLILILAADFEEQ